MKPVIAYGNSKGGAGKTSACLLTAAALCSATFRVAVVDLDPQGTAMLWAAAGEGRFPAHVVAANASNLAAVVAGLSDYDAIFLDCPSSSIAAETLAAIDLASLLVIPALPSLPDFWATEAMHIVSELRRPDLARLVVINSHLPTNLSREMEVNFRNAWSTAASRLACRTAYRECVGAGAGIHQLPGRANRDARDEVDALALEILQFALKAA